MSFERLQARFGALGSFNRRVLLVVLALMVTFGLGSGLLWGLPTAQSQSGPTQISTSADLFGIATTGGLSGSYILMNDIDLTTANWTPIGSSAAPFSGVFDGGGFELRNLQVLGGDANDCRVGLFGFVDGGTVRNVGLRDVEISSENSGCGLPDFGTAGSLVATLRDGRVESSYVVGGTVEGSAFVGGLVGRVLAPASGDDRATVVNSFAHVTVQGGGLEALATEVGPTRRGGLVGFSAGDIRSSYALGNVSGAGRVGVLVGENAAEGTITNSFAVGSAPSGDNDGGLVGVNSATRTAIMRSYQTSDNRFNDLASATYLQLSSLLSADANSGDFATWGDDLCPAGARNAGESVWDFGDGDALPRINCIADDVVQGIVLPTVTVAGVTDGETVNKYESIDLMFSLDVTPLVPVRVEVRFGRDRGFIENVHFTIEPPIVELTSADETVTSRITYIEDSPDRLGDADGNRPSAIQYVLRNDDLNGARLGEMLPTTVTVRNLGTIAISTAEDLRRVADNLNGDYVLTRDITLTAGESWTSLGTGSGGFAGVFNGKGYEIIGLQAVAPTVTCQFGLFGWLDGGTVRNLGLRDVDVSSAGSGCEGSVLTSVGALAGYVDDGGRIEASYVRGGTVRGHRRVGGLVGELNDGVVEGSYADVEVVGLNSSATIGGLVGRSTGSVRSSYALGDVSGVGANLGGLVGNNHSTANVSGLIISSFATGSVAGGTNSGGLFGTNSGTVTRSYQTTDSSGGVNYRPLSAFGAATAGIGLFATWDDDTCAPQAEAGAVGMVWDFGGVTELPIINCIAERQQPGVIVPTVSVTGIRDNQSVTEGEAVVLTFGLDRTPSETVTVSVTITSGTDTGLPVDYTIEPAEVMLGSADDTVDVTITFADDRFYTGVLHSPEIEYRITDGGDGARLATDRTRINLQDITPVVSVTGIPDDPMFTEGESVVLTFDLDRTPNEAVTVRVTVAGRGLSAGRDYRIEPREITLTSDGDSADVRITFLGDGTNAVDRMVAIEYEITGGADVARLATSRATVSFNRLPTVSVTGVVGDQVLIEGESVVLTLELDRTPPAPVTVRVTIANVSLVAGEDYRIVPGEVILSSAGDTADVTLVFTDDMVDFADRRIAIDYELTGGAAGVRLAKSREIVILRDATNYSGTSDSLMLPAFRNVGLSDFGGTVGGLFRAHVDYDVVGGGVLYPTAISWRVSGGNFLVLGPLTVRLLSDGSYAISGEVVFNGVGHDGEIEVLVRQIGAPTEEWRVRANVSSGSAGPPFVQVPYVPPPDPPGVAPAGSVRPSTGGAVVMELASGGDVVVEIPAGASNDFLRVEVVNVPSSAVISLPRLPAGVQILTVAPVLDIELMDSNDDEVRRVNRPTRVCLPLSAEEYGQIENRVLLQVITYHDGAAEWDLLTSEYDFEAEQLCAYTSRFSVFAIGLGSPQLGTDNGLFLPSTGAGGVLGLWGVAGLVVFGAVLIAAGVLVVMRRKFPNFRSARS